MTDEELRQYNFSLEERKNKLLGKKSYHNSKAIKIKKIQELNQIKVVTKNIGFFLQTTRLRPNLGVCPPHALSPTGPSPFDLTVSLRF